MADRLKERLQHAVLALILSAGLVMPLLGVMDESLLSLRILLLSAGVVAAFEAAAMHRISAWAAAAAAGLGAALWILAGGGATVLSDAGLAIGLRARGIRTAVPLAAEAVSWLTAIPVTLLACFATLRRATCIPSVMMCTAVMMILWLTDSTDLLPWLLPALAAALAMLTTIRFENTPVIRVLPWAAALTAAAFLLTGIAPTENPLRDKADEIRQAIMDRLFFTEARDVFSLYSVGYSPQGSEQLGGKPNPSRNAVMQVSTSKTAYLRGTAYNRYDGHGWENTTGGRRYLWQSPRMADLRRTLFDSALPPDSVQNSLSEPVKVSVRMLSGSASTLFVPQRIRELNPGGEMVPYFSNSSEIYITRNLQAGDTYEASAPLYAADDQGIGTLTEVCEGLEDPQWDSVRNTYLELPSHLEQPVTDLAYEITKNAGTPFEKAASIREYLRRNCTYTTDVEDHPRNVDFVTEFLMHTRKGYCTYFASAMTVLCRMAGLPARYVEGYLAVPNANGEAVVTGVDAHAWTEVYFKGFGWLTFDATPGRTSGDGGNGGNTGSPSGTPTPSKEPEQTPSPAPGESETPSPAPGVTETPAPAPAPTETPSNAPGETQPEPPGEENPESQDTAPERSGFPWWLLLLLIPAGVLVRLGMTSPLMKEKRTRTEEERFDLWAEEITDLLRAGQLERRPGETPMAFAERADRSGSFSESLSPAAECLSRVRYSSGGVLEADTGLMRDTAVLLRGELKGRRKAAYLLRRMMPRKRRRKPAGIPGRKQG